MSGAASTAGSDQHDALARAALWREEGQVWLYIGKTLLALYLAAWLAMRLAMPSPLTCTLTVLIVMNRQTGLVLAKAFYRGLGTLLGCVGGVALVALFPQQPLLLLLAMALWAGAMAAGAMLNRNLRAYTFVLAGYTVAMIVLPSVNDPAGVFDTAIWRLAEVGLGLVVASCVFDIAWPNRLHQPLRGLSQAKGKALLGLVGKVAVQGLEDGQGLASQARALGAKAVALEDLRSVALFDDPSVRASDGMLRQLNQRYLHVLSRLQLLQRAWQRSPEQERLRLDAALRALPPGLADADPQQGDLVPAVQRWREGLAAGHAGEGPALVGFADALVDYLQLAAASDVDQGHRLPLRLRRAPPAFVRVTDPLAVLLTFTRAALVMLVMGLLWIASGWNSGSTALFGIVALLCMLSAAPQPALIARQICLGHTLAPVLALLLYSVLPILPTFGLLVLGSLPLLLLILRIGAHPPLAPLGMALNMGVMVALGLGLAPTLNPQFYLNDALAIAAGAGIALLAFILMPNLTGSRGQRRRLHRLLRLQVALAAHAPLRGLPQRFDSRMQDLLLQLGNLSAPGSVAARRLDQWMGQIHQVGQSVIGLRQWQAAQPRLAAAPRRALRELLDALAQLYRQPGPGQRQQAMAALATARQQLDAAPAQRLLAQLDVELNQGHRALCPAPIVAGAAHAA